MTDYTDFQQVSQYCTRTLLQQHTCHLSHAHKQGAHERCSRIVLCHSKMIVFKKDKCRTLIWKLDVLRFKFTFDFGFTKMLVKCFGPSHKNDPKHLNICTGPLPPLPTSALRRRQVGDEGDAGRGRGRGQWAPHQNGRSEVPPKVAPPAHLILNLVLLQCFSDEIFGKCKNKQN